MYRSAAPWVDRKMLRKVLLIGILLLLNYCCNLMKYYDELTFNLITKSRQVKMSIHLGELVEGSYGEWLFT